MIIKMLAVTAFTLSMAGGVFAQGMDATTNNPTVTSECPQGSSTGIDNAACNGQATDPANTGSVVPATPNTMAPADPDKAAKCPQGGSVGIDNTACNGTTN